MAAFSRVLITGGEGMLGRSFKNKGLEAYPSVEFLSLGRDALDVTDEEKVQSVIESFRPDLVVHCAALVNAELCEKEPELAWKVIWGGTKNVCDAAEKVGARVLYPQSFLVFDCEQLPIDESTIARPGFVYGHAKKAAEEYVVQSHQSNMVVVMAGFFGGFEKDKNFVGKIIPAILGKLKAGEPEIEIGDRVWQPTFTDDIAANALLLAERGIHRRYCLSSYGEASFADLTSEIVKILGLGSRIRVRTVPSNLVAAQENAKRPFRAVMSNGLVEAEELCLMRDWRESLREYLSGPFFQTQVCHSLKEASLGTYSLTV